MKTKLKTKKNLKKIIKKILFILFILLCSTLIVGSFYVKKIYPDALFEELSFYLFNGANNADMSLVIMGLKKSWLLIIFLSSTVYLLINNLFFLSFLLKKDKYKTILKVFFSIVYFVVSVYIAMVNLNFIEYYKNQNKVSKFIEENYVNPKTVNIEFPDKKRNLIMIFAESLETSFFTKDQGGYWD